MLKSPDIHSKDQCELKNKEFLKAREVTRIEFIELNTSIFFNLTSHHHHTQYISK